MKFMLLNPWSLVNKIDDVMVEVSDNNVDFAGICETWLRDGNCPTTAVIKSYGYNVLHNIRTTGKKGGGTALLYKKGFSCRPYRSQSMYKSFEYTACSTKTLTGTNVVYLIVYRPGPMSPYFISEIDNLLSYIVSKCDILILAGDLNIHFDDSRNKLYKQAYDTFLSYGLQRRVFVSTHIAGGSLDQIFTFSLQRDQLQCDVSVDSASAIQSDHYLVYCTLGFSFERKYFKELQYRKLSDIDVPAFNTDLKCILQTVDTGSFSSALTFLKSSFGDLIEEHAPLVTKRISCVDTAPWFDSEYIELRRLRRRSERRAKSVNATIEDRIAYREASRACTALALSKKKSTFSRMIEKSDSNPKTLFKLVNNALDRKQEKQLPDYTPDMQILTSDFNNFFSKKIEKIRSEMNPSNTFESLADDLSETCLMQEFIPTNACELKEIIAESGIKCSPSDLLPITLLKQKL